MCLKTQNQGSREGIWPPKIHTINHGEGDGGADCGVPPDVEDGLGIEG